MGLLLPYYRTLLPMPWSLMRSKFKLIKAISKMHGYFYRISGGRVGRQLGKVAFLLLTTTGRKSGKKRSVPLTAIPYGANFILVASFGGSPVHPAWLINIRQNPSVHIRVGSIVKQAKASIVETTDIGYEEMWANAITTYEGYAAYKRATSRHIPIVVITPHEV
jgi:deazaflavin-dependent oxidoreductase (nitroreductase family)